MTASNTVFLSSTCYDLRDARADLKQTLERRGYQVFASEQDDFPVDSALHNHDICLVNVERAAKYVLIIDGRYGSTYDGTKFPKDPLRNGRGVSITWYEYLRALETGKDITILINERIWNQQPVFRKAREMNRDTGDELARAAGVPDGLLDFLDFVLAQEHANWIRYFRDLIEARGILEQNFPHAGQASRADFVKEVAGLLALRSYRGFDPSDSTLAGRSHFLAQTGDTLNEAQYAVYCLPKAACQIAQPDIEPHLAELKTLGVDGALLVSDGTFAPQLTLPRRVRAVTRLDLLDGLIDFAVYKQRITNDYQNYDPDRPPRYLPLRTDLKKYFVPLECKGGYRGDLFTAIEAFLDDPEVHHLTILGDFGTGKSSSMMEFTARHIDGIKGRIPLFFSLRDFYNVDSLQNLIVKGLTERYGVPAFEYPAFLRLVEEGRLLLIFDAFDEMATLSQRWDTVVSLRRLNEAVRPGSKVILTCRTHYFPSQDEERKRLRESMAHSGEIFQEARTEGSELTTEVRGRKDFAIVYLEPFSPDQVRRFVQSHNEAEADRILAQMDRITGLSDLRQRPVLLEMILKTLPKLLVEDMEVNQGTLYRKFTRLWIDEVAKGGGALTADDKLTFTRALAAQLHRTDRLTMHHRQLQTYVGEYFAIRLNSFSEQQLLDQEIRTCDFLNRDNEGNYQFAHKSFRDFFVAEQIAEALAQGRALEWRLTEEVVRWVYWLLSGDYRYERRIENGMVWVPPGPFIYGSEKGKNLRIATLEQGFWIDLFPVTNEEFCRFLNEKGNQEEGEVEWCKLNWSRIEKARGKKFMVKDGYAKHPVAAISWYAAQAYAAWAGKQLPTEEQWEKAARGIDGRAYPWGLDFAEDRANTSEGGPKDTTDVGRYAGKGDSPLGCQEMAGNVWEWTASKYTESSGTYVIRGGSWYNYSLSAAAPVRNRYGPGYRGNSIGVRCSRT